MSLSQQAMMRMAELALESGIKHAETAGALNRYLDGLYLQHGTANNTRIYGEIVFIFHGSKLITVYPLPGQYRRTVAKIRSRKKGATV